ncbi:MAG: hypothetical protein ACP5VQ_06790 [Phycisphaerae bacterium]
MAWTLLVSATSVWANNVDAGAIGSTVPATAPAAAPTKINACYATPTAVIKTLALAIKAGNSESIRQCLMVRGRAGHAAVVAFSNISAASEKFVKTALSKLGPPPTNMALAFGSIDASMDRLLTLLPKAVTTIHHGVAQVKFPASATGQGQTIFVRQQADGWKVDGARLLHLNKPGLAVAAVRHRAKQLNLLAAALRETTTDIHTGKVKTWTSLEKDMELHILESEAAMEAKHQARTTPSSAAISPPPPAAAK